MLHNDFTEKLTQESAPSKKMEISEICTIASSNLNKNYLEELVILLLSYNTILLTLSNRNIGNKVQIWSGGCMVR